MINSDKLWVIVGDYYDAEDIELYESEQEARDMLASDDYAGDEYLDSYRVIPFETYIEFLCDEKRQDGYEDGYDAAEWDRDE